MWRGAEEPFTRPTGHFRRDLPGRRHGLGEPPGGIAPLPAPPGSRIGRRQRVRDLGRAPDRTPAAMTMRDELPANQSMPACIVIPELGYEDVPRASGWLGNAFGFEERRRAGRHRAQLTVADGAVALTEQRARPRRPRRNSNRVRGHLPDRDAVASPWATRWICRGIDGRSAHRSRWMCGSRVADLSGFAPTMLGCSRLPASSLVTPRELSRRPWRTLACWSFLALARLARARCSSRSPATKGRAARS